MIPFIWLCGKRQKSDKWLLMDREWGLTTKGQKGHIGDRNILLFVVAAKQLYAFVNTHQTVHFKCAFYCM